MNIRSAIPTPQGLRLRRGRNGVFTAPDSAQAQYEAVKRAFPDANVEPDEPAPLPRSGRLEKIGPGAYIVPNAYGPYDPFAQSTIFPPESTSNTIICDECGWRVEKEQTCSNCGKSMSWP